MITGLNLQFSIDAKTISYLETSRGVAFTAKLLLDDKPVGSIENRGVGGFTAAHLDDRSSVQVLLDDAAKKADTTVEFFLNDLMDIAEGVV